MGGGVAKSPSVLQTPPPTDLVGGVVLVVRSFEATANPELRAIDRVEIVTARVELEHGTGRPTVDTQLRRIIIHNKGESDHLVAQYRVPVAAVSKVRIFPTAVTIHLKTGGAVSLDVPSAAEPSWKDGWKIEPVDAKPWSIVGSQFTGVRILFRFDERMIHTKGTGYKFRPTAPAEQFNEEQAIAGREACYQRLIEIERELVGHVLALQSSSTCATDADCVVVPVEITCLKSCPNVVAGADVVELQRRLAESEVKNCSRPVGCTMQSMCARTTAVCSRGRCRARWEGIVP